MNILVVGDEESKRIWDHYQPGMLDKYELILSVGDLSPHYLEFLVTMSKARILYVRGNHDDVYKDTPPLGCKCIENQVFTYKGLRILGLGGSMKYKNGQNMYTEREMRWRVRRVKRQIRRAGGFDILLTHAPARGLHDAEDLPHQGFQVFLELLDEYAPRYFLYGHVHQSYGGKYCRKDSYKNTAVINGGGVYELEIPDEEITPRPSKHSFIRFFK